KSITSTASSTIRCRGLRNRSSNIAGLTQILSFDHSISLVRKSPAESRQLLGGFDLGPRRRVVSFSAPSVSGFQLGSFEGRTVQFDPLRPTAYNLFANGRS